jgi:hypothetical protein
LEIHRNLKLLSLFERFIENYFKSSIYFLKNFLDKSKCPKYYFLLSKPMQVTCKEYISNVFIKNCISKLSLRDDFKQLLCEVFSLKELSPKP